MVLECLQEIVGGVRKIFRGRVELILVGLQTGETSGLMSKCIVVGILKIRVPVLHWV